MRCVEEIHKSRKHGEAQERAADGTLGPLAPGGANGKSAAATAELLGKSTRTTERIVAVSKAPDLAAVVPRTRPYHHLPCCWP